MRLRGLYRDNRFSTSRIRCHYRNEEVFMSKCGKILSQIATRAVRRYLVGPDQKWHFDPPPQDWTPPPVKQTSLYLHVPFCRNCCPYCPYTKVAYDEALLGPYTQAALAEVDWWADKIRPAEITSIYIGGGTPTLALDSVAKILARIRKKFHLTGDICIETNPSDVNEITIQKLHDANISLVSLGVQSFCSENLKIIGRNYEPNIAEYALALLANSGFASVNVDLMFALPGQTIDGVIEDLARAVKLGASQLTTYPLFTFPYTSIGKYLNLKSVRMPDLRIRKSHYRAINEWCMEHDFKRVSVWGFKRGEVPRYSSVTRDSYIGIGPGAGSHLPDGFVINTFDLNSWVYAMREGRTAIALRMPFTIEMSNWWWLYWRFYDTRIPLDNFTAYFGKNTRKARCLLKIIELIGFAVHNEGYLELTESGAFWLHLVQNHFALSYINTVWTQSRRVPWPQKVTI
ncbi:MAG: radical SAM protein [Actinobacteria bacterium]|nr:radical SAM protein [Actinomycetota bacterium]